MNNKLWYHKLLNLFVAFTLAFSGVMTLTPVEPVAAAGVLSVSLYSPNGQPLNAYNLVVDSNATSPSTYAPSVATVAVRFCNTAAPGVGNELTNVWGFIGTFNGASSIPGTYPARNSTTFNTADEYGFTHPVLHNSGMYAFSHVGGAAGNTADASRYIGTLQPGECRVQYWHFTYPQCKNVETSPGVWEPESPPCSTVPTWGSSVKPEDDLWLRFNVWATADGNALGAGSPNATWRMTMRNEISAMANKIEPNPNGAWFNTNTSVVRPGDVITSNGVLYSFGNINQGFDNDGDYVPDYNAWAQPLGDPSFDPTCFRLIRTTTLLTVSRSSGLPPLILNFTDQLYYTNLPSNNTGAIGEVRYTFLALSGPCSLPLTPYQEVASGRDNEKFNGDYGTGIPPVVSSAAEVILDKQSSPATVGSGETITYKMYFQNTGSADAGLTLNSGIGSDWGINAPLVIVDSVPVGMLYVGGSSTYTLAFAGNTGVTRLYSTDSGETFSTVDPGDTLSTIANTVVLQWWLNDPLPKNTTGNGNYVEFQARVPASGYTGSSIIENEACGQFGSGAAPFTCDTVTNKVTGSNVISGTVFEDDGASNAFANEIYDSGESPISGITVTLYISTTNGWLEWDATTSDSNGDYSFTNLPDGEYRIDVGSVQSSHPGWTNTTATSLYVDLDKDHATTDPVSSEDNDFGFAPALTLDKTLIGPSPALEDQLISYTIDLNNILPGDGTSTPGICYETYTTYSTSGPRTGGTGTWTNPGNAFETTEPGSLYASNSFPGNADQLRSNAFSPTVGEGTISKVEVVFLMYLTGALRTTQSQPDIVTVRLYTDTTGTQLTSAVLDNATLNGYTSPTVVSWDLTNARNWSDLNFSAYFMEWENAKSGGADGATTFVNAMGWRVTVTNTCGGDAPNTTINPLPLTDTYDANKLAFVSAEPAQSNVTTGGASPYTNTGAIYWNNLGPLYAGGTETVTVTFRVKDGTYGNTITNTATVDNAYFTNGNPTNDATDVVTTTVNRTARLGDRVWNDFNGDGSQTGELGIAGVTVTLTPQTDVVIDGITYGPSNPLVTTTDEDGYYLFIGLPNATYVVAVTTASLPGSSFTPTVDFNNDSTNDNSTTAVVGSGTVTSIGGQACTNCELNVDFGYQVPNTLMGTIWQDYDGLDTVYTDRDAGDDGFSGVTVNLEWWNGSAWVVTRTTTTNADGAYTFSDLPNGDYRVVVDSSTLPDASSVTWDQTVDPNATLDDTSGTYSLSGGQLVKDVDFAYHQDGDYTLGGTVYADWDGEADLDENSEPGFEGVTVKLYSSSGALIATTTTNANGVYTFTDLITDTYTVVVDRSGISSQYNQTEDYDESGVCVTCDSEATTVVVNDANSSVTDVDFGYHPTGSGSIGDTVWRDMNGDSMQSGPRETGIISITVSLQIDLNGDGNWVTVAITETDANGKYLFSDLPDGTYRVLVDTDDSQLPQDGFRYAYVPSTTDAYTLTMSSSIVTHINGAACTDCDMDFDFGFKPLGAIGDTLYWDANANGEQDWNEVGIGSGIVVTLTNTTIITLSDGTVYPIGTYELVTTTNASGQYFFTGLVSGTYQVEVGPITGNPMLTGDPDTNGIACYSPLDVNDPNYAFLNTWCDGETIVKVFPGTVFLGADFGYKPQGVIGDYVWLDADGDGIQDAGESGIAGLVITATNGTQTFTTTTDFDGRYTFANLDDGTWSITIGNYQDGTPFNLLPTYNGTDLGISHTTSISNGVGSMGRTSISVTLSSGVVSGIDLNKDGSNDITTCSTCDHDLNIDFGFKYNGSRTISGHVFFDAGNTGDGANDLYGGVGDVSYTNVPVYLWYDGMIVGQTTTNASGAYTFTNVLAAAGYTVSVDRTGLLSLMDITASPNTGENFNTVDTSSGNISNQDFGFYANMDMGDLPDSYNFGSGSLNTIYTTRFAYEGPMHINNSGTVSPTIYLGAIWDAEADGQPDLNAGLGAAGGDRGDEDGINFLGIRWSPGITVTLQVTVTDTDSDYTPYLVGWFDWNQDGRFANANETVLFGNLADGVHNLPLPIPASANMGRIFMRFRLYETKSPPPVISPVGAVENGEVEDYYRDNQPTAVTLVDFAAAPQGDAILVTWETASELDNLGFNLYRSQASNGPWVKINGSLIPPQFPGSVMGGEYEWLDTDVAPGVVYYYRLEDVETTGIRTFHGPVSAHLGSLKPTYTIFLPFVARQP